MYVLNVFTTWQLADSRMPCSRSSKGTLLRFHNQMGGRIAGASRWSTHLDDMPVMGWGYSALLHNLTTDFHALLYGHAATYQSRGSFHATEQLSFLGEGLYRSFLHFQDPLPPASCDSWPGHHAASDDKPTQSAQDHKPLQAVGDYYAPEQDVSYCIVTEVLGARLTRLQLLLEDLYRPSVEGSSPTLWLARGAPRRWFRCVPLFSLPARSFMRRLPVGPG